LAQIRATITELQHFFLKDCFLLAHPVYHGVQALMAGSISHFILPRERLEIALRLVQQHLEWNQPHMTLSRRDFSFYYNQAAFKTFRKGNILFLVVDVPITTESLAHSFRLFDVIKLPLPTPEMHDYYCLLATDITTIGFSSFYTNDWSQTAI